MHLKRLLSLLLILIMMCGITLPSFAEEGQLAFVVRSAPLVKSSDTLDGMVRVYLSSLGSVTNLDITIVGSYSVDGNVSMALSDGDVVRIAFNTSNGQITMTVNGISYAMGSEMSLRRHQASGQSAVKIAQANRPNNMYPGDLQLIARTSGSSYKLYPIVHVYIEYYLYGVVPYEMSSSWPAEALKAQSVAARTYTLNRMNGRESYIYDLVDTSSDQVYNGYVGTETNATRAVDATKGIVIMNNGKLSGTYYTASNGGQTEAVANAWGSTAYPYLGVKDDPFDLANPNTNKRKLVVYSDFNDPEQNSTLTSLLTAKAQSKYGSGVSIRTINSVTPHTPKYAAPSRLYTKLDFGVTLSTGGSATLTFGIFEELESALSMSINSSKNELWYVERDGSDFIVRAARYGHGIGMSQRGAQQMSNMGYTYDQILGFYYEGCERIQYTFTHTILPSIGAGDSPVVSTEAPATIAPDAGADARIQLVGVNDSIAIRYTPSASGKTLIAAVNGSSVKVVSYGSEWTLIRYGEICGYVPTSSLFFVTMPPTDPSASATNVVQWGTVKGSSSLNMRDEGSYDGSVIGSIPVGEHVAILKYGTWSRVQYGQQVGYCLTSYLTISSAYPGNLVSSSDSAMVSLPDSTGTTPLFATASTSGTILLHIPHGTQVTVHSNDGSWSRVTVSGVTGYVLSVALDFAATGTTPTEPPLAEGEVYAIVASDASTLNLRNGPSTTYDIITEIPRGTQIVVTSYGTDWCAVRWGSLTGYVMTKYLSFDVDTPTPTPTVPPAATNVPAGAPALTVTNTDLYMSASATSEVQLVIPDGETVSVVEYGNTWTQIAYGGLTGYVYTSTLQLYQDMPNDTPTASPTPTPTPTATAVPTYAPANASATLLLNAQLREEPDSSSTLLGTIPAGAQVKVTAIGTSWSQVVYNGDTGWVLTSQLLIQEEEATPTPTATAQPTVEPTEIISDESDSTREGVTAWVVTTVTSVNLRADASMEGAVLASLPGGTCIVVLEEGATWSLVRYGSKAGYVFSQYIMYTEPHEALGILYVNTAIDPLALRNKPTTSSTVLLRMPRGSTVTLLEKQGDWCYVQYGQTIGYCASRYLSTEKPEAHVSDDTRLLDATLAAVEGWEAIVNEGGTESIFLRAWCSVEAPDVVEIQPDKRVTVIQKGNVWCLISYEGNEGYCLTGQLHLIPPAE